MDENLFQGLCDFSKFSLVKLDQVACAIQKKISDCYNVVDQIVSKKCIKKWDELYSLIVVENELKCIWYPVAHLNSVKHDLKLRVVYEKSLLSILEYKNWVNHHYGLYKCYQSLCYEDSYRSLNMMQKVALKKILLDYELSGIHLSVAQRKYYKYMFSRLSKLSMDYVNNVLDSTLGWRKLITDKNLLSGIPDNKLKAASLRAKINNQSGWLFTLQYPSYSSVLLYCDNSELREEFYWAFRTRASDIGPGQGRWDNTDIMNEILILRYELSRLLGFNSYFERSVKTKMARCPQQVFNFLIDLYYHIYSNANQEFLEIQRFARKYYSCVVLRPWDIAYYQEKFKQFLFYGIDSALCAYFPENQVLYGMFELVHRIYGIAIKNRSNVDIWHSDVRYFDVFDSDDQWIGGFYLDLYLRDDKHGGAWMDVCTDRMYFSNGIEYRQRPIAYLICNFDSFQNSETVCLLSYDDVLTLFHEFGHVLHHILTTVDIPSISGVNGVFLDVVEIPSQLMEKFFWESDVLQLISKHYMINESLPQYITDNLLKLKVYQAASNLLIQVIYGLFDFCVHHEYHPKYSESVSIIFNKIVKKMSVYPVIDDDRFSHSFVHIFSDDYAAGYYSYLWSDMLASYIWCCCKKLKILDVQMKKLFANNILSLDVFNSFQQYSLEFCEDMITTKFMLQYYDISVSNNIFFTLV